jgi:cobalt-zinc-cadmium efflux system outer membrane protein
MLSSTQRRVVMFALALLIRGTPAHAQSSAGAPPLTLSAVLDAVTAHHPAIQAAQARVRAAQGSRITAGAFGNPILGYQVDNTPFPGGGPVRGLDREAMTTATLPLEPLYQHGPRVRRADALVRGARDDAIAARQRVTLDASAAFYRVALAQIGVSTSRDLLAWLDTVVAYNRSRVTEGVTAESDLIRSELERDRAAAEVTMQEVELAQARAVLAGYIGDPRSSSSGLSVAAGDVPMRVPDAFVRDDLAVSGAGGPAAAGARGLSRRADVHAAEQRVLAASAGISVERTMILRQLGATIGTKQTAGTTSMIAGISLPIPFFDPNRGETQRATAERDAAAYELQSQQRMATAEIVGAYTAAELLTERATQLARTGPTNFLARADEGRRIALGAYREGAVPLLQVLDAARTWGDARLTFYRTLFAQHQSVLALIVAEGGDLMPFLAAASSPTSPDQ